MKKTPIGSLALALALLVGACGGEGAQTNPSPAADTLAAGPDLAAKLAEYASFTLKTDLSTLSEKERQMIPLLLEAAAIMDQIYWSQAYGDKDSLMASLTPEQRAFAEINYGPWERLADNLPFVDAVGPKPLGANFYPTDMTPEEFEALADSAKTSQYTLLRRDEQGKLIVVPYHQAYAEPIEKAAGLLEQAAALAEDKGLAEYLRLRAQALRTDDYLASDMAWMSMKTNRIDFVVGPIENYEDQLFGHKAAHEAFLLVKDMEWSQRLEKYAAMLPEMQRGLPVPDRYKAEKPGTDSELNAYDVIFYAGDCNSGSKTIAINLPNDERVQLAKGSRRLQLKNAMRAKFDIILLPIAELLVDSAQRRHVTFDAFFSNTMFHEVAHGLGIKNLVSGQGTVRDALAEQNSWLEEAKADILGLYLVTKLHEKGELGEAELMDNYVTFMAGIFRSVRFGGASAHGTANLVCYNFFKQRGAFTRSPEGIHTVDFGKTQAAMNALAERILTLQGDGALEGVRQFRQEMGVVDGELEQDLDRIGGAGIPRDIVFEQGRQVLGL